MTRFQRILLATDFSPASKAAFDEAARLARESGAALLVVHAYEAPVDAMVSYWPVGAYLESFVAARMQAEARMQELLTREALRGLEVRPVVTKGLPAPQIVEAAIREKADLIVMGTHGRRRAARLILGSVAASVIALAPCPVLTIRTTAAPDRASTASAA
jgi:nucleotide-binding universal stress UspA family protein